MTVFDRIEDGSRSVRKGDTVRLTGKSTVIGTVLYFTVNQVPK